MLKYINICTAGFDLVGGIWYINIYINTCIAGFDLVGVIKYVNVYKYMHCRA